MTILAAPPAPAADAALSVKQQDSILDAEHSLNIWEGSIRSGKTIASICTWMMFIRRAPRGPLAIIGKTRDSAYRNVIDVMFKGAALPAASGGDRQGAGQASLAEQIAAAEKAGDFRTAISLKRQQAFRTAQ